VCPNLPLSNKKGTQICVCLSLSNQAPSKGLFTHTMASDGKKKRTGDTLEPFRSELETSDADILEDWFQETHVNMKEGGYEDVRMAMVDALDDIVEDQGGEDAVNAVLWKLCPDRDCVACIAGEIDPDELEEGFVYGADVHVPRIGGQAVGQFCAVHLLQGGFEVADAYQNIMDQAENDYFRWLLATATAEDSAEPKKRKTETAEEEN